MDRREFIKTVGVGGLALGLLPGCGDDGGLPRGDGGADGGTHEPFSIVALPDTQYYAESHPAVFTAQTKWIVDNAASQRIEFVTHLGDMVDNGPDLDQWKVARQAMAALEQADVPHGICLGNHDLQFSDQSYQYPATVDGSCTTFSDFDCTAADFVKNFGPQRYAGKSWFGGGSSSGMSSYQLIQVEGFKLLFLHLCLDHRKSELLWAQKVLDQHPDALVHLSTHRYMYDFRLVKGLPYPLSTLLGGRYTEAIYGMDDELYFNDAITADQLFANFVRSNTNIFMVQCGHFDAEYRQVSRNDAGLPVHELLVDFQSFSPNGGDGWLRLLTFDVDQDQIRVQTYSPSLKRYRQNGEGLDGSLKALQAGLNAYRDLFKLFLDINELDAKVKYWSTDPTGRKEYSDLLYGGGERDSDFTLDVKFKAYLAASV